MTTLHVIDDLSHQHIRFPSGPSHVSALLFEPVGVRADRRHPAVVVGGSLTALKEQTIGIYAGALAEPTLYGGSDGVAARQRAADAARNRFETEGVTDLIQAYSNVDETASHPGPNEYYMDQTRGGGVPQWLNAFAVMAWRPWLDFDPISQATGVTTPALIVHTDDCALPGQARKAYELLRGPKRLHWTTGPHFDFYDQSPRVGEAVDMVAKHFDEHLG